MMINNAIKQLIAQGEGVEVEFKESCSSLSKSVFETICAFLNRKGGHILLGVKENWNRPFVMGRISLENMRPHPKNPTLANFFKQLGWVEELGSGVRKLYKYCPIYYKGRLPVIEEGDVFKMTIYYDDPENGTVNGTVNDNEKSVLLILESELGLNATEIAQRMGKGVRTVKRYLSSLALKGLIEFKGIPKTGGYFIKEKPNK